MSVCEREYMCECERVCDRLSVCDCVRVSVFESVRVSECASE